MKKSLWFSIMTIVAGGALAFPHAVKAAPEKVLVVTTTLGFRHSSNEGGEALLEKLAKQTGEFTVKFARGNPNTEEFLASPPRSAVAGASGIPRGRIEMAGG